MHEIKYVAICDFQRASAAADCRNKNAIFRMFTITNIPSVL